MKARLFGINHGGPNIFAAIEVGEIFVSPSKEFSEELKGMPRGTKVGLEWCHKWVENGHTITHTPIEIEGEEVHLSSAPAHYWNRLLWICREKDFEYVFLDDIDAYFEYAEKIVESHRRGNELEKLARQMECGQLSLFPELMRIHMQSLKEEVYRADVEAEYIHVVRREEGILRKMKEERPDVIIVGTGHADYFIVRKSDLEDDGIEFECYSRDEIPPDHVPRLGNDYVDACFIKNAFPDHSIAVGRDRLKRKYNAAVLGCIVPGGRPDLIGTWNVSIPARGLFEMYVETQDGDLFSGSIEDTLGGAHFDGRKGDISIEFAKEYGIQAAENGAAKGPIEYRGILKNGRYEGSFNGKGTRGSFWIKDAGEHNLQRI